ncbi:MAG: hypothetical protein IPK78_19685 [Rhodospirillales bacterium]|nr:hypothetical protein [Rhodospirillales bacterium]
MDLQRDGRAFRAKLANAQPHKDIPLVLDFRIPIYPGGYRMDADALQEEIDEVVATAIKAILTEDERRETHNRLYAQERWTSPELEEGQRQAAQAKIEADPAAREIAADYIYTLAVLRRRMSDEFGIVEEACTR